jgi:ketosteroid isomerase-like protein
LLWAVEGFQRRGLRSKSFFGRFLQKCGGLLKLQFRPDAHYEIAKESSMTLVAETGHGATALRAMQCLSARDMAGLREILADDIVVEWPFAGRDILTYHGGETAIQMFSPINIFESFQLSITDIHELPAGDTVILQGHSHGVFADSRPDYVNRYVFILTIAQGKITRWREYFNPIEGGKTFGRADQRRPVSALPA